MIRLNPGSWLHWGLPILLVLGITPGQGGDALELQLRRIDEEGILLAVPLRPGERFIIDYRHSVDGGPVSEAHSVDRSGLIFIEEERFLRYGAGMGHWAGHGTLAPQGSDCVIAGIHRPLGRPILRIGSPGVDHALTWRGRRVALSSRAPGVRVRLVVRPVGPAERLWKQVLHLPAGHPLAGAA
jgi:hypothetical protein